MREGRPERGLVQVRLFATLLLACAPWSTLSFSRSGGRAPQHLLRQQLWAVVPRPWGDVDPTAEDDSEHVGGGDEPTWLEMFPVRRGGEQSGGGGGGRLSAEELAKIDFSKLKADDPLFLDMPWPTEVGPEASAFARHMQWRRRLSDGERVRWQRWAVYARLQHTASFAQAYQYGVADYVFQQMQREMQQKAQAHAIAGRLPEAASWDAIAYGFAQQEQEEVQAVVKCFYSALNRHNYDELSTLLLPDDALEFVVPGHDRARSHGGVERLLKRLVKENKPFGNVRLCMVACYAMGYTAVVHAIETIEPGSALKVVRRGKVRPSGPADKKRVLSTLVLRKYNKQWRISSVRFKRSNFLGDRANTLIKRKSRTRDEARTDRAAASAMPQAPGGVITKALSRLPDDLRKALGVRGIIPVEPRGSAGRGDKKTGRGGFNSPFGESNFGSSFGDTDGFEIQDADSSRTIYSESKSSPTFLGGMVDSSATLTKQAFQAVKLLCKAGKISQFTRDTLVLDMVRTIAREHTPLVEVAYELLVNRPHNEQRTAGGTRQRADSAKAIYELQKRGDKGWEKKARELLRLALEDGLEEEEDGEEVERRLEAFREQCIMIATEIERDRAGKQQQQEEEEEEDDDDEGEEDDEEEENDDDEEEEANRRRIAFENSVRPPARGFE